MFLVKEVAKNNASQVPLKKELKNMLKMKIIAMLVNVKNFVMT